VIVPSHSIYGDLSQLKKAKADLAMQSKGWQFSTVDRKKLRSLHAKLFLTQADNVTQNNMATSSATPAGEEGSHGHDHTSACTPV
jgi:hypothetical protein